MVGTTSRRPFQIAAAAALLLVYFAFTLAAISLLAFLLAFSALVTLQQVRAGVDVRRTILDRAGEWTVFGATAGALLLLLYVAIDFDPVERYSWARSIQRSWGVTNESAAFWVATNLLGYFLSFGLIQAGLLMLQPARSARRLVKRRSDAIDHMTLAWLCLLLGLVVVGSQHGETNRLWAFLTPAGCLIVARPLRDRIRSQWLIAPLLLLLLGLGLARVRLIYF
jgi:hypothetical protein